jgi:hypothetical protein
MIIDPFFSTTSVSLDAGSLVYMPVYYMHVGLIRDLNVVKPFIIVHVLNCTI